MEDFQKNVWTANGKQLRPELPKKLSPNLKELLHRAWDLDLAHRPSANAFENALKFEASLIQDHEGALNDVDESPGQTKRRSTFLFIPGKGEAVNRSSPTVMALAETTETDIDIFHAVGAAHNSVFASPEEHESTRTTNVFDSSIESDRVALPPPPLRYAQSDSELLNVKLDCQMNLSSNLDDHSSFPPPLTNFQRDTSQESAGSIDSLDL